MPEFKPTGPFGFPAGERSRPTGPLLGLILPGGGARGAYQVGVLAGIAELIGNEHPVPFPVIVGTSVGAMTATYLASHMTDFASAMRQLVKMWSQLAVAEVYRASYGTILSVLGRWLWSLVDGGLGKANPSWLLDNTPLRELISINTDFDAIERWIEQGLLRGIAVTVAGYRSERSLTYFQALPEVQPWWRERREGRPARISVDHVMASLALPIIFPAVQIGDEWCGDGSTRQFAPLAPAIHLGAERILIIDTQYRFMSRPYADLQRQAHPSLSRIGAYLLDTIFSDSLYIDLERAERVNRALTQIPPDLAASSMPGMRQVKTLLIAPSRRPPDIAARHIGALPKSVRWLLRSMGGELEGGEQLLSYLLFAGVYTSEMIELGRRDALVRRDELRQFLGLERTVVPST